MTEQIIEQDLINKLKELKYIYRDDIRDRVSLELNFRAKFEELNRVKLTDSEPVANLTSQKIQTKKI